MAELETALTWTAPVLQHTERKVTEVDRGSWLLRAQAETSQESQLNSVVQVNNKDSLCSDLVLEFLNCMFVLLLLWPCDKISNKRQVKEGRIYSGYSSRGQ